jgi:uncharacterized membrane protein YfcA
LPELFFILACLCLGALSGFLGGLLGIGGGIVIVPGLLLLFDAQGLFPFNSTLMAVGTSLTVIVFTSLSAGLTQIRASKVLWPVVRIWTPGLLIGGGLASSLAVQLPTGVLRSFIGLFLLLIAAALLASWQPHPGRKLPGPLAGTLMGGGTGLLAGLAGIGGGNMIVPTLVYHNVPMHTATGTSSALGVPIALSAAIGYALAGDEMSITQLGYIYTPAAVAVLGSAMVTAPFGVQFAHRTDAQRLRRYFALLLLGVGARMLWMGLNLFL